MAFDLRTEKDMKLYVENAGIEYRFLCEHERDAEGCQLLGEFLEIIEKKFEKAAPVFKSNCDDRHYGRSCYKYANYCYSGRGLEAADQEQAQMYYDKGCDYGEPTSCLQSGKLRRSKAKVDEDFVKSLKSFQKGCILKNRESCFSAASALRLGRGNIPCDMAKAFNYNLQACELRHPAGCANVSVMYRKGEGVEQNETKSKFYLDKSREIFQEQEKGTQLNIGRGTTK